MKHVVRSHKSPVIIPGIVAGKPGQDQNPVCYDPQTDVFYVGDDSYKFVRQRSKLALHKIVDGKVDCDNWVAADLEWVREEGDGKTRSQAVGSESLQDRKIRPSYIGIPSNRGGASNPSWTDLPLFLAYLSVHGATHACVDPFHGVEWYYQKHGFDYNEQTQYWERSLPKVGV